MNGVLVSGVMSFSVRTGDVVVVVFPNTTVRCVVIVIGVVLVMSMVLALRVWVMMVAVLDVDMRLLSKLVVLLVSRIEFQDGR